MTRAVAIGIGLGEFTFSHAKAYWRWVDMCEEGGVDSIWQSDRIVSREPYLECMTDMAAIAGRTRRIKFGISVISLAFRDPVLVAKQCATIDFLSDGRLLPAFGIGSSTGPEWDAMGLSSTGRGSRTDESLEIIGRLWKEDEVDFEGKHYRLKRCSISPRPVQPELPMWIGGSSEAAIRRTAKFGTGWQGGLEPPAQIHTIIAAINSAASARGRAIDPDHFGTSIPFYFGKASDAEIQSQLEFYRRRTGEEKPRRIAIGDVSTVLQQIASLVEAGISKFVLRPMATRDETILCQTRQLMDEIIPAVSRRWPKARG